MGVLTLKSCASSLLHSALLSGSGGGVATGGGVAGAGAVAMDGGGAAPDGVVDLSPAACCMVMPSKLASNHSLYAGSLL